MQNRIYKFRAWDKKEKRMCWNVQNAYDTLSTHCCQIETDDCRHWDLEPTSFGDVLEDNNFQVMQFTGLTDKNGKELYEGDVVQLSDKKLTEVRYVGAHYYLHPLKEEMEEYENIPEMNYANRTHLEVVGNVWENSEFLKTHI